MGWIKRTDLPVIRSIIKSTPEAKGQVFVSRQFEWSAGGETCFEGTVDII